MVFYFKKAEQRATNTKLFSCTRSWGGGQFDGQDCDCTAETPDAFSGSSNGITVGKAGVDSGHQILGASD